MNERKTRKVKVKKQQHLDRQRAAEREEQDRTRREAELAENWMRFVNLRFPTSPTRSNA